MLFTHLLMVAHRAADITQNVGNLFRPGQQETIPSSAKRDPDRFPVPRYYVKEDPDAWSS